MGQQISRRIAGRLDVGLQRARQKTHDLVREEVVKKHRSKQDLTYLNKTVNVDAELGKGENEERLVPNNDLSHEMSEDLVKFLNDVGPLERKVDKNYTSPRLRESLQESVLEERNGEKDSGRKVRKMPIHGTKRDHVVNRTTNFSTRNNEEEKEKKTGLSEVEFYVMLTSEKSAKDFLKGLDNKEELREQQDLIEMSQKYIEIPTILKDTKEIEYLGVAANQLQESELEQFTLKPATDVKLVLSQLLDRELEEMISEKSQ
mmetsp:Transcript_30198/g.34409  ORF Transcript_30198/g.34409 Transcript_30198/m.34409 type:complete len:260 (+) Transcript_30198:22-801(+)